MFCEKCGKPIPDGQQACGFCNPPSQEPLHKVPQFERAPMDLTEPAPIQQGSYTPPAQQPLYQAPVQEPVQQPLYQAPVQEPVQQPAYQAPVQQPTYQEPVQQPVYQPPVQQPVWQESPRQSYTPPVQQPAPKPAFELNMPAEGKKKKGSGGKIALVIIALVLVAAIVVTALNWGSISRFFKRNFAEPAEYLQDVEKENVAEVANDIAAAYEGMLSAYHPEGSNLEASLSFEVGDQIMTLLSTALAQSGVQLDLSWLENIVLEPKVEMYENTMRMDLGVGVNSTSLATVSCVWDMDTQTIYVGVPELHDTYIQMDATEILGEEAVMMAQTMAMSRQMTATVIDAMPDSSQVESLINKYFGIIVDELTEVEKTNETVKAGGLEQELLVMRVELSQKDILKIATAVLEAAQDDETIEEILDGFGDCMRQLGTYGGEELDLYDAFSEVVDEGLENLEYMVDEADSSKALTIETFLDSTDTIVGREFTIKIDGMKVGAHYITVTEGDKFAFDAELDTVTITGKGTIKDGKRSGSYTLAESGTDYVTLELEDFASTDDGQLSGTFRLIPESAVYEMMELDSSVTAILGQAALEMTVDGDAVTLGIEAAGSQLLSFTLSGETTKPSQIALPNGVSTEDNEGGMKWLSELDFDAVLSNLEAAGVPAEYMTLAEQVVEMFRAEFN